MLHSISNKCLVWKKKSFRKRKLTIEVDSVLGCYGDKASAGMIAAIPNPLLLLVASLNINKDYDDDNGEFFVVGCFVLRLNNSSIIPLV